MPDQKFEVRSGQQDAHFEGLEFIEIAVQDPQPLDGFLRQLGFRPTAHHRSKQVTLYCQGQINLIINSTPDSFAAEFAGTRGTSVCALALRTDDATSAYQNLLARGAWEANTHAGAMELNIPAIEAIGGTQIYLVDRYGEGISIYDIDFKPLPETQTQPPRLSQIRSLSLNMPKERVAQWQDFYSQLFGFSHSESQNQLSLGELRLKLVALTDEDADLDDERISQVQFAAEDIDACLAQLKAEGLQLKAVPDSAGGAPVWEVMAPLADLNLRFLISH